MPDTNFIFILIVVLFGFILIINLVDRVSGATNRLQRQIQDLTDAWTELAGQLGLTFVKGKYGGNPFSSDPPMIFGEYRGFYINLNLMTTVAGEELSITNIDTRISIQVKDGGRLSLTVKEKSLLSTVLDKNIQQSGDEVFDRVYCASGSPPEFVRKSLHMIVPYASMMFTLPDDVIFVWSIWRRPTISLDHSNLVCIQHGTHTDVNSQKEYIDLLCDLADLAEGMSAVENRA